MFLHEKYGVIQKDELNFVSLYFEIVASDKCKLHMIILTMQFEG